MSSSRSNAATWLPVSVLHVDFGLTPEYSVAMINVSGLIVDCWYVKISFGFLDWVLEQFLPVIPVEMTLDSVSRVRAKTWPNWKDASTKASLDFYSLLYTPKASFAVWMLTVIVKSFTDSNLAASQPITILPALLLHHAAAKSLQGKSEGSCQDLAQKKEQ